MAYFDEATFRTLWGDARVNEYFPESAGLALALEMAQDRVYSAITAAGHKDKPPSYYSAISAVPGVLKRACFIALKETAYSNAGLPLEELLSLDEREVFERLRAGVEEVPGTEVDSTTRAVGGVTYTQKGVSSTSSTRTHEPIFGRSQMKGYW